MRHVAPPGRTPRVLAALALSCAVGTAGVVPAAERFRAPDAPPPRLAGDRRVETTGIKAATPASAGVAARGDGRIVVAQDSWSERLGDHRFWRPISRYNLGVFPPPAEAPPPRLFGSSTYRTVCVRLCDGAFFPLSFATTSDNFEGDAARCQRSCGAEARLFVHRNPGGDMAAAEDLDGRPYRKLASAFRFKTHYDEACKCRPHPWEDASLDRHKVYALEAVRAKGNRTVVAELDGLKAKLRETEPNAAIPKGRAMREVETADPAASATKATRSTYGRRAGRGLNAPAAARHTPPDAIAAAGLPQSRSIEPRMVMRFGVTSTRVWVVNRSRFSTTP